MNNNSKHIGLVAWGTKRGEQKFFHSEHIDISSPTIRDTLKDIRSAIRYEAVMKDFYGLEFTKEYKVFTSYLSLYDQSNSSGGYLALTLYIPHGLKSDKPVRELLGELQQVYKDYYIDESYRLTTKREDPQLFFDIIDKSSFSDIQKHSWIDSPQKEEFGRIFYKKNDELDAFFADPYRREFVKYQEIFLLQEALESVFNFSGRMHTLRLKAQQKRYNLELVIRDHSGCELSAESYEILGANTSVITRLPSDLLLDDKVYLEIRSRNPNYDGVVIDAGVQELKEKYKETADGVIQIEETLVKKRYSLTLKLVDQYGNLIDNNSRFVFDGKDCQFVGGLSVVETDVSDVKEIILNEGLEADDHRILIYPNEIEKGEYKIELKPQSKALHFHYHLKTKDDISYRQEYTIQYNGGKTKTCTGQPEGSIAVSSSSEGFIQIQAEGYEDKILDIYDYSRDITGEKQVDVILKKRSRGFRLAKAKKKTDKYNQLERGIGGFGGGSRGDSGSGKKKNFLISKKIIFFIVLLILLAGGFYAVNWFGGRSTDPEVDYITEWKEKVQNCTDSTKHIKFIEKYNQQKKQNKNFLTIAERRRDDCKEGNKLIQKNNYTINTIKSLLSYLTKHQKGYLLEGISIKKDSSYKKLPGLFFDTIKKKYQEACEEYYANRANLKSASSSKFAKVLNRSFLDTGRYEKYKKYIESAPAKRDTIDSKQGKSQAEVNNDDPISTTEGLFGANYMLANVEYDKPRDTPGRKIISLYVQTEFKDSIKYKYADLYNYWREHGTEQMQRRVQEIDRLRKAINYLEKTSCDYESENGGLLKIILHL